MVLQRQVPQIRTVLNTVEIPINQVTKLAAIHRPVVLQRQVPQIRTVLKTVEIPINQVTKHVKIPQTLHIDKVVVDLPVVMQRQVPRIQTSLKTVEVPPAQFVGRVMEAPMACVRWHAQNAAASPRASRTTHAMNVASTATSENVPPCIWHACTRCTEAAQAAKLP